jgi:hypothetical protein
METIAELVAGLRHKDNQYAYDCLQKLTGLSEASDAVYAYFDDFAELMRSEHSYFRGRGMTLIAANARWDADNRIDETIDEYLKHLEDVKPITARLCIRCAPEIARFKPDLRRDVETALRRVNTFRYRGTMQPLIRADIAAALAAVENGEAIRKE